MKTPYLDDAIKRHEEALKINMLSDGGKEALIEFKAIKQYLLIQDVPKRNEQLKSIYGNALTALNDTFKKVGKIKPTLKDRL